MVRKEDNCILLYTAHNPLKTRNTLCKGIMTFNEMREQISEWLERWHPNLDVCQFNTRVGQLTSLGQSS